jgi:hypothetical protein
VPPTLQNGMGGGGIPGRSDFSDQPKSAAPAEVAVCPGTRGFAPRGIPTVRIWDEISADAMEDCCFICAEPLEWVAFGPCGHKEACSKCVMRMRFVLKDSRCIMCQQDAPAVFVTRAMGAFTASIPLEDFAALSHKVGYAALSLLCHSCRRVGSSRRLPCPPMTICCSLAYRMHAKRASSALKV